MLTKLTGGIVYDPLHRIDGEVRDVWFEDSSITDAPPADAKFREINVEGKVVMPGGVDIHTHIGGGKNNIARCMMAHHHEDNVMPGSIETGFRYTEMGYTACFEPAMLPANARQAHLEMADTPILDVGAYALLGNDDLFLRMLSDKSSPEEIKDYVAWTLDATQALAIKVVNPGGINAFKFNQRKLNVDDDAPYYNVTPRAVVKALSSALADLKVPHPLHIHASNLGVPGNFKSTLDTIDAAEGRPIHITHVQFHSYGTEGDRHFSSAAKHIAEAVNNYDNVSTDVGQIMFGQTVTASADAPKQLRNSKYASPKKWLVMDIECDAGCGVVPFQYRDQDFVNALQWAIGLEIFLMVEDPWRIFLTTDHPNGGPFTSYPHLIKMLMNRSFRNQMLDRINPHAKAMTTLEHLDREYSLYEIAIMTRAAPAASLGLKTKGHLGAAADADIVVYEPLDDIEAMFAKPLYVFKGGELVAEQGRITDVPKGRTHVVKPEYDKGIEKRIKKHYEEFYTTSFENAAISEDEMAESIGSSIEVHPCQSR